MRFAVALTCVAFAFALQAAGLPGKGICGHQGDYATCPDDTVRALRTAVEKGACMVEFDVQRCLTGNVSVTGGVLEFADGGSWTNGHSVSVGGTGTLVVSTPSTFAKDIELSLDGEGVISIADGVTVKAEALFVGGTRMPSGRYAYATAPEPIKSHLDPLTTGAILVKRLGASFVIR